jgi:hypothetical protein
MAGRLLALFIVTGSFALDCLLSPRRILDPDRFQMTDHRAQGGECAALGQCRADRGPEFTKAAQKPWPASPRYQRIEKRTGVHWVFVAVALSGIVAAFHQEPRATA